MDSQANELICRYKGLPVYQVTVDAPQEARKPSKRFCASIQGEQVSDESFEGLTSKINDSLRRRLA